MFGFLKDLFGTGASGGTPATRRPGDKTGRTGQTGKTGTTGKARKTGKPGKAAPNGTREQALARIRENQERVMTPERAELIRKAMEVRRAKQQILGDLDDEQRQKLAAMAIRAFLNEGKDGKTE